MERETVFAAGDCPVCPGFGSIFFVKSISSGALFFLCPYCGVAWKTLPRPDALDEIAGPEKLAPAGIDLPSRNDIDLAGLSDLITAEHRYADWAEALQEYFLGL